MSETEPSVTFDRLTDLDATGTTLIEGLPGHGLVAAIAVDQVTRQLGLAHHGNIRSEAFPPVAAFRDGRVRDAVRVYAGEDPPVMTLQSDVAIPPHAFRALSQCVLEDLATEFDRAIFLAGAPVGSEEQLGDIIGVTTTDDLEADLRKAGIELAQGVGALGGVTGALVHDCFLAGVPAAVLVVGAHPFVPDPSAAREVIETALEPLVAFDVDTTELQEQADEIRRQMQQIAEQYQHLAEERAGEQPPQRLSPSMYQ